MSEPLAVVQNCDDRYYWMDNEFLADLPVRSIRVGVYASDDIEIRPDVSLLIGYSFFLR